MSYGSSFFSFLRTLHTIFHSVCTSLHSHQQLKGLLSQHLFQHLLFVEFLMIIILTGVRWDFIIVLIYITLMITDVEYVFIHLLVIHISSFLKNVYSGLLPILESGCLFWYWVVWAVYLFWILIPYQSYHLQILSPIQ